MELENTWWQRDTVEDRCWSRCSLKPARHDGAYPPGGTTCKRGTLRGARAGHWTGARLLALLLLVPVVDDELEPMTDATTISPSPRMEALRDRAGSAPILMRHVGIFLFKPRDFGLHELVEVGQLLSAAGTARLSCVRARPPDH